MKSGWPVWGEDYAPYGQEVSPAGAPEATSNIYKFTGYERDPETAIAAGTEEDYAQARYYSSAIQGRFMSPDPDMGSMNLANPQSFNRYTYAMNNPLRFTDPMGLDCVTATEDGRDYYNYGDCAGLDPNNEYYFDCDGCLAGTTSYAMSSDGQLELFDKDNNEYVIPGFDYTAPDSVQQVFSLETAQYYGVILGEQGASPVGGPSNSRGMSYNIFNCPDGHGHDPCAAIWQQSNCVVNQPFTTAADDLKWGTAGAAFVGASGSMHSGVREMLKGATKQVGADVMAVGAAGAIAFHSIVKTGYSVVEGCSSD